MADINIDTVLKLPKNQRIGILIGSVVLIIVLYYFLFYSGHTSNLKASEDNLTKRQHELDEQRIVLADLPRFQRETDEMKKKRQDALKQLPDKKDIDKLLQDISFSAVESGLEVMLFKPQPEIGKNFYAEIPVDVKLSGRYHELAIFFDKIANLSRIVNISDIAIASKKGKSTRKGKDNINLLQTSCKATTYRFIEGEKGGKVGKGKKKKKK
jgi:type IV pilus assembly protein PilO